MIEPDALVALKHIVAELGRLGRSFCVVGGFGVSIRGEVRFTRDVDVAVAVKNDSETESLARDLRALATVRLRSPSGITVDLLTASSGIEPETVSRATPVDIEGVGAVPVAQAEELLAMKVLSMDERRLQDRMDALKLLEVCDTMDLPRVRADLRLIEERGFSRKQDLAAKLDGLLAVPIE
jgi:predicted nucleotidyltransferase